RLRYQARVVPHRNVADRREHAQLDARDLVAIARGTARERKDAVAFGPGEQHRHRDPIEILRHDVGATAQRTDDLVDDLTAERTARDRNRVGGRNELAVAHHVTERDAPNRWTAHEAIQ